MRNLLVILLLLIAVPCVGANYYVTPDGDGDYSGSSWANAAKYNSGANSLASFARGDTYYFAGGTYTYGGIVGGRQLNTADGAGTVTLKKATATECATHSDPAACATQASFVETLNTAGKKSVWHIQTSGWTIDGVSGSGSDTTAYGFKVSTVCATLTNSYLIAIPSSLGDNVAVDDISISHVAVVNCGSSYDVPQSGIIQTSSSGTTSNFLLYQNYMGLGNCNLDVVHCTSNCIIDGNYFDSNWSSAANHGGNIVTKNSSGAIFRNNYFKKSCLYGLDGHRSACAATGVTFTVASRTTNTITASGTPGWTVNAYAGKTAQAATGVNTSHYDIVSNTEDTITVSTSDVITEGVTADDTFTIKTCYGPSDGMVFYNNIFDGVADAATCSSATKLNSIIGDGDSAYVDVQPNLLVYNNTFYNIEVGPQGAIYTGRQSNAAEAAVVRNNLFYGVIGPGQTTDLAPDYDYNSYLGCSGTIPSETHPFQDDTPDSDPFLNKADGNFAIQSNDTSTAYIINRGGYDVSATLTTDRAGNARIDTYDMGAYEYTPSPYSSHSFSGGASHSFTGGSTVTWGN